jgi:hypothetical protein
VTVKITYARVIDPQTHWWWMIRVRTFVDNTVIPDEHQVSEDMEFKELPYYVFFRELEEEDTYMFVIAKDGKEIWHVSEGDLLTAEKFQDMLSDLRQAVAYVKRWKSTQAVKKLAPREDTTYTVLID